MLVAGASGVVGAAAIEHFASRPNWQVLALSRRPGFMPEGFDPVALDLTDRQACLAAGPALASVTHVIFTALYELPDLVAGWRDPQQMAVNLAMLRNLMDSLQQHAQGLRHITLMQGAKAYGSHVEPAPVPAKERWPRHPHENFYWLQEDLLRERQRHANWTFSILRPQYVFGYAVGSPMNLMAAIGAYAVLQRESGLPLGFPGGGRYVCAASDSRLIAAAAEFAATHEIAANQTYNVVNGDMLVWQDLWPAIARHFGMAVGPDEPIELARHMPTHEARWAGIVDKYKLQRLNLAQFVGSSWQFADRAFGHGNARPHASVLSGIKLRQHGFAGCEDTEDSTLYWLKRLQANRLLPG